MKYFLALQLNSQLTELCHVTTTGHLGRIMMDCHLYAWNHEDSMQVWGVIHWNDFYREMVMW